MVDDHKRPFDTYQTKVVKTDVISPRVKNIQFSFLEGKSMDFLAGQFVQMFIPQPDKPRRTSYSIASPPRHKSFFELCVTHVEGGKSSTYLHGLKVGDTIQAMGPLGRFTLPEPLPRETVFIATGSGIAPFRSMIQDQLEKKAPQRIDLIFGNRFPEDILYQEEWVDLARRHPHFRHLFTLSRPPAGWTGEQGYVQEKIAGFIPDPAGKDFYICGLVKMIEAVTETLTALGVGKDHIHFERYD